MKRGIQYAALVFASVVLTTLLQPLSLLPTFAGPVQQGGCQTFKETGKTVCGKFLIYWQQHGALPQQGYPISNEFSEKSDLNGQTYTVQYFERAVFELHPENQPPYDVLLSQLGTFRYKEKYPNAEPTATPAPPPGLGVGVTLQASVTITLVQEIPFFGKTGIDNCQGMWWVFEVENKGTTPYTINLDQSSVSQVDSTGKSYKLGLPCGGDNFVGLFTAPQTVAPGDKKGAQVRFNVSELPPTATYLDLYLTINGRALTFRYPLR